MQEDQYRHKPTSYTAFASLVAHSVTYYSYLWDTAHPSTPTWHSWKLCINL